MAIKVTVDMTEAVAGLHDLQKTSLPFAAAKTLTGCAKAGQQRVQENLGGKFTLRNDFTRQGIRIKPAQKTAAAIEADVHTDTANRKTGAPDYLVMQETGGEKVPHGGRSYLAVPTKYLRQMCPGPIPFELRPRNLLSATGGMISTVNFSKGTIRRRSQKRVNGFEFFLQEMKDDRKAIMGRYFTDRDAYPFYLLIPEAQIKPRFQMEKDVQIAVDEAFPKLWAENWRQIMLRGLRIKI